MLSGLNGYIYSSLNEHHAHLQGICLHRGLKANTCACVTQLLGSAIELDIDEMDIETQWVLDRFVTNYNEALSKSSWAAIMTREWGHC